MEREEKHKEMEGQTMKLKGAAGMVRGGPTTPSITWRLHSSKELPSIATSVSARKLCATLWEIHPHLPTPKLTPNPRQNKKKKKKKKKGLEPLNPPDQAPNASSSRRHVSNSLIQHHKSTDRPRDAQQPLSSSSMKVVPLNLVQSPTNSLDFKGRVGEPSYSLKTSSELRKVLNRIWSLEENQSCSISLLKSLKVELNRSHSQIRELLKEKQSNRQDMDCLMLQVAEDKVSRKNKEQDHVKAVIQSARAELEGERKLRKHSESLHRKLARELTQVKSAFSNALRELERDRKARILLENLCDEFAEGIRDYEQEVRSLRQIPDMDHVGRGKPDRLVLHISEAWLDERMQMRLSKNQQNDVTEKNTIVDKLSLDIETFLRARHSNGSRKSRSFLNEAINNCSRRESFPLNEAGSAPRDVPDGEDSIDSDIRCIELNKSESKTQNTGRSKVQVKLNRNQSVSSEGDKIHPEENMNGDSYVHQASRKQGRRKSKSASPEIVRSESSLQLPSGVKENTLKAKLLEARLEGRKHRRMATASGSKASI
ncbi:uncharacterized protein At5g41620 [Euphorbia lathyris]|uniref:uncharacterized protein At5g41620 n=1 Tax=Euphorbia lathyris TaxID=212925 RepID=UPI00331312D3